MSSENDFDFLDDDFDIAEQAKEADKGDFEPLPTNPWYLCRVIASELKESKNGTGKYVEVRLDVTGPTHAGRVLFDRIVVVHENERAVEIGRPRFAALCVAAGFAKRPSNAAELIGSNVAVKVKTEKASNGYEARSVPRAYALPDVAGATSGNDDDVPF
jgi:hypothetical protein